MSNITDELKQIPLLSHLDEQQLKCIASHGTSLQLKAGDVIAKQGDPPDGFYIILEGITEWTHHIGQQNAYAATLVAGDVFAELILLLNESYPTTGRALTDVRLYKLEPDAFWFVLQTCPTVMRQVLKTAAERSHMHESVIQQHAKLISLGTMSAGLAHELNNPAAAIRRSVESLLEVLSMLPSFALRMHEQPFDSEKVNFLCDFYHKSLKAALKPIQDDPLSRSEAEDEVSDWLEEQGVNQAWKLAPTLVASGLEIHDLKVLKKNIDSTCLESVLVWLESTLNGMCTLHQIKHSSTRISDLINAMKDYTYMDRGPLQEIDVHDGIENTLTIMKYKLKYGVEVIRDYGDLPHICAYGRELNQVWTNLIDNAVDAMNGKGKIWIRTRQESDRIRVEIADDGSGIPLEVQSRIFEQFFTTKEAGKGTGLGLDIVRRIVEGQHKGSIRFESKAGDTRFQIRLPINAAKC
ncbi:ATP-binding protein [Chroococcus sp. FPU101]|uniref:ATP-binding protein n=1 Tax=Chroococcus sp. FPU101 TaxID=1974212 RepID=UPI001A8D9C3D|nr:ATP-binding protein [Chroococcus sp. FPU101]GFE71454.1 similar to two-component sensor histidine kinase [Chroococcus sp. FPU101]